MNNNSILIGSIESTISRLNINPQIKQSLEKKGLKKLYDWQRECLFDTGVVNSKNLLYCAPTSGGKSLVADLIVLKKVTDSSIPFSKVLVVLPFISLVSEKNDQFKTLLRGNLTYNHA